MVSKEENELITRVCREAPLGRMLRKHYWIPASVSSALVADGTPARVRLLGENYVAFRATDGRVGFFDEACPHRGVSLALGRNEDNALRCIFHGWKFGVDGPCLEVPTQPINHDRFCKQVALRHYAVREAAGLVWVYLGERSEAPAFPRFDWLGLEAPTQIFPAMQVGKFNWLQAVETTMDSAHLGILHSSSIAKLGDILKTRDNNAPRFEVDKKPYGFRYASIRAMNDGRSYVRVNTFVAPWYSLISPTSHDAAVTVQFTVPVDDENSVFFFLHYRRDGGSPKNEPLLKDCVDAASWPPGVPDLPQQNWGQDRAAMKAGHFTGFTQHLFTEDLAMVTSMLPIVDRSKETLNAADAAVVNVRRSVEAAVKEFLAGEVPASARHDEIDYDAMSPVVDFVPNGVHWREHFARQAAAPGSERRPASADLRGSAR
jgi:nitrite reductase/ring-hydroxylating ferredoxin subunit